MDVEREDNDGDLGDEAQPAQPAQLAQPAQPGQPAQPAQPEQPAQPAPRPNDGAEEDAGDAEAGEGRDAGESLGEDDDDAGEDADELNEELNDELNDELEDLGGAGALPAWSLLRYLNLPMDVARLAPAFGGVEEAQKAMRALGAMLHDVDSLEHAQLGTMVNTLAQYLEMLHMRPSTENGQRLRDYIDSVENSMHVRSSWPIGPAGDTRLGTALEGIDHFYFEHDTEGLIRLQWVNPLPKPEWMCGGGYQCDVCCDGDLLRGYQHVNEDNARDHSSFLVQRVGFDVCAGCAAKHIERHRMCVRSWLGAVPRSGGGLNLQRFERSCATKFVPPDLRLGVVGAVSSEGVATLEVTVQGTGGLFVAAAVLPADADGGALEEDAAPLPACWLTTGSSLAEPVVVSATVSSPPLQPAASPETQVEFTCASGDCLRVASSSLRGVLLCCRRPAGAADEGDWGESVPCRALSLSNRALARGGEDEDTAAGGEVLPFVFFQGLGRGAWLASGDSSRVLGALHGLASRAGVVHNIPRQGSGPGPAARPRLQSDASSVPGGCGPPSPSAQRHGGIAGGFLAPLGWDELTDCMICLDDFGEGTWFRGAPLRTQCGHLFHTTCLRRHLRGHHGNRRQVCPICRAEDPLKGAQHLGGSDTLEWTFKHDAFDQSLDSGRCYRVAVALCQDPLAVVDSAMVLACASLKPGDPAPPQA